MLTSIRSAFSKGILRIFLIALMSILVLSFAIWGVGDVIRGGTNTTVATIGKAKISAQELQTQYQREVRLLSQNMQRPVTSAELAQMGLDRLVLQRMITDKVLDAKVEQLGLDISDEAVANKVQTSSVFQTAGRFDRLKFNEMTRELGYSDATYLELEKKLMLRQHLVSMVSGGVKPPQQIIDAAHIYNSQKRTADFIVLTAKEAGTLKAPSTEDLTKFYEERKASYKAPEYRKATVINLTQETIASQVKISEDDIKARYELIKQNITDPEKRELERLAFPSKEKAEEAAKSGKSFDELAKELNINAEARVFGTFAQAEMIDKNVATAAFALASNAMSQPIETPFGTIIIRVKSIKPAVTKPLSEVSSALRQDMENNRAKVIMGDLHDKIEKERSSGLPLADIAEKVGLKPQVIESVDAKGFDKNGVDLKLNEVVLKEIFDTGINVEKDSIRLKDGGEAWVEVKEITPGRDRTLQEVSNQVTAAFFETQTATLLKEKAASILKEVEAGKPLSEAAKPLAVLTSKELTRFVPDTAFSSSSLQTLFQTPKGKAATAPATLPAEQIVFVVKDVITPAFEATKKENGQLIADLKKSYEDDLLVALLEQLKKETTVSIDETIFRRAIGNKIEPQ